METLSPYNNIFRAGEGMITIVARSGGKRGVGGRWALGGAFMVGAAGRSTAQRNPHVAGSERRSTAKQIQSKSTEFVCPSSTRPLSLARIGMAINDRRTIC